MRLDVALASCLVLPDPDADAAPLLAALRAAGLTAEILAWDDPTADFASARLTLVRATWNYPDRPEDFLRWVERTAARSRVLNPLEVVRWNVHKSYLLALEAAGVPVVPTHLVRRDEGTRLADIVRSRAWDRVVIKPAISAGSRKTICVGPDESDRGEAHLRALAMEGDVLVQPYVASVEGYGERSLVWIDGELTHAVRKARRFLGDEESVSDAVPIAPDEADLARAALAAAPRPLLYARIDIARDAQGKPRLMELELIEPSLFFPRAPAALDRYVRAVRRQLDL
jgi:hypothetical protein